MPTYFLGVELQRSNNRIVMCQRKYILDLLNTYGLIGAKPATTPIEVNHQLSEHD